MPAAISAVCIFSPNVFAQKPTTVGPKEHPKSPARASRANITVPPVGIFAEAMLNVPGQKIPTDSPQTAHPSRPNDGTLAKAAII